MKLDSATMNRPSRALARRVVGTRLFLVSYAPLWFIFAVRSTNLPGRAVFLLLTAWGLVDAVLLITAGLRRSTRRVVFEEISDKSGEVSGYLATYLLPFIGGPPSDLSSAVAYVAYFTVAWAVFVPSTLCLVNPTFYLLGWRVVEGTRRGQREIIICQDPPPATSSGEPVAQLMGGVGWVRLPTRPPWTWIAGRTTSGQSGA